MSITLSPRRPCRLALLFCLVSALATAPMSGAMAADRVTGEPFATRSEVIAPNAMAATSHPLATQIALDILRRGGHAVDAAIAANAALGLMEPTGNGIGGDLFAIVWDAEKKELAGLNASGRAPASLTIDKVPPEEDGTVPVYSVYSWTVPGCADGWFELHEKFGNLPMEDVLRPAAKLAREGAPVPQVIAAAWERSVRRFGGMPGFDATFMPGQDRNRRPRHRIPQARCAVS